MDMQYKIRYQAEQQTQAMKDIQEFISTQDKRDTQAKKEAEGFDQSKIILPGVRGVLDIKQDAEFKKAAGNQLFKEKKYQEAEQQYQQILEQFQDLDNEFKASLYLNIALCNQKTKPTQYLTQESFLSMALSLQPNYQKARINRARVFMKQERWQDALDDFYQSGREQEALQSDIQQCIQKIQEKQQIGKVQIQFDEDSQNDDDAEKPKQQQAQQQQKLNYEPNYQISEEPNSIQFNQQFYTKICEFERYPDNLSTFLNNFHSSILTQVFDDLQTQITIYQLEKIINSIIQLEVFTVTKKLNTVYSIFSVKKFQQNYNMISEQIQEQIQSFLQTLQSIQLTDVQKQRFEYLTKNLKQE